MNLIIKKTDDYETAFKIAKQLPDFFNKKGLEQIKKDTKSHILFGAFLNDILVAFVTYNEINQFVVEMSWLAVSPDHQAKGIGTKLIEETLSQLGKTYKVCEVKTLAKTDLNEPYEKTRKFYEKLAFMPLDIIDPYPGWEDNPCQIYIKFIEKMRTDDGKSGY